MQLQCSLCLKYVHDKYIPKTDSLWLRTIRGRDYLVCAFHKEKYREGRKLGGKVCR